MLIHIRIRIRIRKNIKYHFDWQMQTVELIWKGLDETHDCCLGLSRGDANSALLIPHIIKWGQSPYKVAFEYPSLHNILKNVFFLRRSENNQEKKIKCIRLEIRLWNCFGLIAYSLFLHECHIFIWLFHYMHEIKI